MKEQLMTANLAKLAKEKGFFIEGIKTLDCEDGCIQTVSHGVNKQEYLSGKLKDLSGGNVFIIETLSLLQKWLREKHGIVVDVFQESKNRKYTGMWKGDISMVGLYQEQEFPIIPIIGKDFEKVLELVSIEALKQI